MLAEGLAAHSRTAARVTLLAVLLSLLVLSALPASRGELPTVVTNPDASRTVTWTMNDPVGLTAQNVSVAGGRAALAWSSAALAWTSGGQMAANGTLSPSVSWNASGLALRANWSNYVQDGGFTGKSPWRFTNGTSDNVTADWNVTAQVAELGHRSPSTQSLWDSMDAVTVNWSASAGGAVLQNLSNQLEGAGMMGLEVVAPQPYIGAVRQSLAPVNWSVYDRLILSIRLNTTLSVSFNVTAHYGSTTPLLTTAAQPLSRGWQEVVVDLDQLGNATVLGSLTYVTLRFNGQGIPASTWYNVDNVRLGKAKVFQENASVSQEIWKANETTRLPGSARLSFDWCLARSDGVQGLTANVTFGPSAPYPFSAVLAGGAVGNWQSFSVDVSSASATAGSYNVSFSLAVTSNNTTASDVDFLVDNVTLVFPEITNGTFISAVQDLNVASDVESLAWTGNVTPPRSVEVGLRTGNDTDPASAAWSGWQNSPSPGSVPVILPGARYFQVRVFLNTTNASVSPLVQSLTVISRHRAPWGMLTSGLFRADEDFLHWRSFRASAVLEPRTSLSFRVGDNTSWTDVGAEENLSSVFLADDPQIMWRVNMTTSDGLQTPTVLNITLVYEYAGPVTRVRITPSGPVDATVRAWVHLQAATYDAGWHLVSTPPESFAWSGGDPSGHVYSNGSYLPGEVGNWTVTVTATVNGLVYSDTVRVYVRAVVPSGPSSNPSDVPYLLYLGLIVAAAAVGFFVYEFAIRRMFAIDDVFVISRDGRLLIHNTRRMRADRDEDVLSGMLTAMISFLRDWDPEENGKARRFDYGSKTALLEHGEHVFVAAVYAGRIPGWAPRDLERFVRDLEVRFGSSFAKWTGDPADLHGLREFVDRFSSHARYRGGGRTSRAMA